MIDYNKKQDKGMDIIINSRITTKDVRDTLWRCRDFELSHLWQRSIFLNTMLVLCFTGYGIAVMALVNTISEKGVTLSAYTINNIVMIISLVSLVFSWFCIIMAKGSKAWYERYENAIDAFEGNDTYMSNNVLYSGKEIEEDSNKIQTGIGGFQYINIKNYKFVNIKDGIFSCRAGAYSPSRINIAIGQVSFVLWFIAFIVHLTLTFKDFQISESTHKEVVPYFLLGLFIAILLCSIILAYTSSPKWIKSNELLKEKRNNMEEQANNNKKSRKKMEINHKYILCGIVTLVVLVIANIPLIYYLNHFNGLPELNKINDFGVFGDYIGGTTNVILNFFTLVFSLLAVYVSIHISEKVQKAEIKMNNDNEKLLRLQNKPVPYIHLEKGSNVSVELQNMGNGTMIVDKICLVKIDDDKIEYPHFRDLLDNEGISKKISSLDISFNTAPKHALASGQGKDLLKIKPIASGAKTESKITAEMKSIQDVIAGYKIKIKYKDIFGQSFPFSDNLTFLKYYML